MNDESKNDESKNGEYEKDPANPRDIVVPKEKIRRIHPEQVEILGEGETASGSGPRNPFEGTPFQMKNIKVISSGPLVFLLPILIPLALLLMLLLALPLMIFGRLFLRRRT